MIMREEKARKRQARHGKQAKERNGNNRKGKHKKDMRIGRGVKEGK